MGNSGVVNRDSILLIRRLDSKKSSTGPPSRHRPPGYLLEGTCLEFVKVRFVVLFLFAVICCNLICMIDVAVECLL